jgi:hypothetical protein
MTDVELILLCAVGGLAGLALLTAAGVAVAQLLADRRRRR